MGLVDFRNRFAILVCLVESLGQLFALKLTEGKDLSFPLIWLLVMKRYGLGLLSQGRARGLNVEHMIVPLGEIGVAETPRHIGAKAQ